jgi:MFS transporter, MHS family, proline/betaine transporter
MKKEVWIGWFSSMAEAYNMAIYSFMAPLLAASLFQQTPEWQALFFSYTLIFVAACFLYPSGAIYYGTIGDLKGRQKACMYSTLGLGAATGLMGILSFENGAWIYFLLLICAQHFFSGGEYHSSVVFSLEHAKDQPRGLMSALSCLFAVFGLVAANGLASLSFLMENAIWIRICFFIGGLGGLLSFLLKYYCAETPAFSALSSTELSLSKESGLSFLKTHRKTMITVIAILAFFLVSYTFIFIFLPLIPFEKTGQYNLDTFKALIVYGLFLVTAGVLADKWGVQKVMKWGLGLFCAGVVPRSYLSNHLFLLQCALTLPACFIIGPIHSWLLHQFEVKNRCRGILMSSAIATSIFGGSTVPICLMIFEFSQSLAICSLYPLLIGLIAFYLLNR